MTEFLVFIQLQQTVDIFNGVRHTFHDVVGPFAGGHMPGADDLEIFGFIDRTSEVAVVWTDLTLHCNSTYLSLPAENDCMIRVDFELYDNHKQQIICRIKHHKKCSDVGPKTGDVLPQLTKQIAQDVADFLKDFSKYQEKMKK